jgi:hypothetical protein
MPRGNAIAVERRPHRGACEQRRVVEVVDQHPGRVEAPETAAVDDGARDPEDTGRDRIGPRHA